MLGGEEKAEGGRHRDSLAVSEVHGVTATVLT